MIRPGLYFGTIRHRRARPTPHAFSYPLFLCLLDVDRIPEMMRRSRFTSYNRFNWASFCERDHTGDPRVPLRDRLEEDAERAGFRLPPGPVYLLTHLRYLGYAFNPVSFYYCCSQAGEPELVLAEVNNTFGESHNYWFPFEPRRRVRVLKEFHVSPFLPMDLEYHFLLSEPRSRLSIYMDVHDGGGKIFDAALALQWREWNAPEIRRALLRFPWMTAKVIAAIHWQAVRLFVKRIPFFPHPSRGPVL